jgi:putative oxidoreductase
LTVESLNLRYRQYAHLTSYLQSFVLLFLRLTIAWQLAESGYGHLTHVQETAQHFREWGVPLPTANVYISGTTELVGGILLILGLGARLISVPLLFNFIVAYATASRANVVQLFAGPKRLEAYDAVINDAAFTMIVLSLTMLAFGAGKFSLDSLMNRAMRKKGVIED